jgi:hypothetical protein
MADPAPVGTDVQAGTYRCVTCGYKLGVRSVESKPVGSPHDKTGSSGVAESTYTDPRSCELSAQLRWVHAASSRMRHSRRTLFWLRRRFGGHRLDDLFRR